MPEVIVKTTQGLIPETMKREFGAILQSAVAHTLSVPGTQAKLHPDEVEVDFQEFSPFAARNGIDCAITVTSNLYPERDGKADEYAKHLEEWVRPSFPVHDVRFYVWVNLVQGGFHEGRSK